MTINYILSNLVTRLNMGTILSEPTRVYGGLLNRMYKVVTDKGCYAFKQLNQEVMKRKDAMNNHIYAEKIARIAKDNGIPCIPAIEFNGNVVQEEEGNYFLIYNWYNGKTLCNEEVKEDHIIKIAKILHDLHNTDFGDKSENNKINNNEIDYDYYIPLIENNNVRNLLITNKNELKSIYDISIKSYKNLEDEYVISHRDMDIKNILWDNNNNPVVIDWESTGPVNPLVELIDTAWNWSGGQDFFNIERFKLFIKTYGCDSKDLKDAYLANYINKLGWLEYNLRRASKIECADNEEKELGENEVVRTINEIFSYKNNLEEYILNND